MIVLVPDEFREEVLRASADRESLLLDASAKQGHIAALDEDLRLTLVNAGWSAEFADWYLNRARIAGSQIELRIPAKSRHEELSQDYGGAVRAKKRLNMLGNIYLLLAILFRVAWFVVVSDEETIRSLGASVGGMILILMLFLGLIINAVLFYKAMFCYLDAKQQSRWWALIGLFIVFVPDRNKPVPPTDSAKATKHGEAVLSDW